MPATGPRSPTVDPLAALADRLEPTHEPSFTERIDTGSPEWAALSPGEQLERAACELLRLLAAHRGETVSVTYHGLRGGPESIFTVDLRQPS